MKSVVNRKRNSGCVKQNARLRHDNDNFWARFLLHWMITHQFNKAANLCLTANVQKLPLNLVSV